jgi:hypothetical protein
LAPKRALLVNRCTWRKPEKGIEDVDTSLAEPGRARALST